MSKSKKFLWGASSAAHQVEGNNYNNWTVWEQENAVKIANDPKDYYLKLSKILRSVNPHWGIFGESIQNPKNYISGIATDHYNRYKEDFIIAKKLGHNCHRFSIEWSRIEPKPGEYDQKEIEHYRQVLLELKKLEIEPVVTLLHFSIPVWAYDLGGFSKKTVVKSFLKFVDKMAQEYDYLVTYWIVVNEPIVYTSAVFFTEIFPGKKRGVISGIKALHNFIYITNKSVKIIKNYNENALVGSSKQDLDLRFTTSFNHFVAGIVHLFWNLYFLIFTNRSVDFIGLNYYISKIFGKNRSGIKYSDMGWGLYPKGIYNLLMRLRRFGKPILITECGLADMQDNKRAWYIDEIVENIKKAKEDGANIIGFLYWSLTDNFEWDKGFWPRFGLVEIDYENGLKRKIRPSAMHYKNLIEKNKNL